MPLKVTAFARKMLQDRIPTKDNMMKGGVKPVNGLENNKCELCGLPTENVEHLLFTRKNVSWCVWASGRDWWDLKLHGCTQRGKVTHLGQHLGLISNGIAKEVPAVLCHLYR